MSHRLFVLALLLGASAALAPPVQAGLPGQCWSAEIAPAPAGCQFRFHPQGLLDELVVHVTLRDIFCVPVPNCSTSATVIANAGTQALCSCEAVRKTGFSDPAGVVDFVFDRLGGRGTLAVGITAHPGGGDIPIAVLDTAFTSPDLDGSCELAPASSVTVMDLAIWALGLVSYRLPSDFTCDGDVGVADLGMWASGYGRGCGSGSP